MVNLAYDNRGRWLKTYAISPSKQTIANMYRTKRKDKEVYQAILPDYIVNLHQDKFTNQWMLTFFPKKYMARAIDPKLMQAEFQDYLNLVSKKRGRKKYHKRWIDRFI